jgi:hypothetical protein
MSLEKLFAAFEEIRKHVDDRLDNLTDRIERLELQKFGLPRSEPIRSNEKTPWSVRVWLETEPELLMGRKCARCGSVRHGFRAVRYYEKEMAPQSSIPLAICMNCDYLVTLV